MTKLPLALATLAVATVSAIALTSSADAGGRRHFRFHNFHVSPVFQPPEPAYVHRKRRVAKPAAPVVKYVDGEGREFDRVSKTWFDGGDSCWKGDKSFGYRGGAWFYGNARWVQTSSSWGVSSGDPPDQVECAAVKAFAGKIASASKDPESSSVDAPKPTATKEVSTRAAAATRSIAEPKAPEATANASDCKKYLPSLGEIVSVPCNQ